MVVIKYPGWWSGASYYAKASWLKNSHYARSFEEACGMLGKRRKKRPVPPPTLARLPYKDD